MQENKTVLTGTYVKTIKKDFSTGWTFFTFLCKNFDEYKYRGKIYCSGYIPVITKGIPLKLSGIFQDTNEEKNGKKIYRFIVSDSELFSDKKEITIDFLKSDRFKGIGEKTAIKIVENIGNDIFSFAKQKNASEILSEKMPEFKEEKAKKFIEIINDTFYESKVYEFLRKYGGDYTDSQSLFSVYDTLSIKKIKENPYEVGYKAKIPFIVCDAIAKDNDVLPFDENRIKHLIIDAMYSSARNGNTLTDIRDIYQNIEYTVKNSAFPETKIPCSVIGCFLNKFPFIIPEKNKENIVYYLKEYYTAEKIIAKNIDVLRNSTKTFSFNEAKEIENIENKFGIKYSEKQKEAFLFLHSTGIKILTGGPGTGKSTVINGIISLFKTIHPTSEVVLCAPTGRAAQKMKDITGHNANTLHRLLNIKPYETDNDNNYEADKLTADLVIVDEVSMVDTKMFAYLANSVKNDVTLILVGDTFQLPSVGAGNILQDLMETKLFETVELNVIHRQKELSKIIEFSQDIKNGNIEKWLINPRKRKILYNSEELSYIIRFSNKELQLMQVDNSSDIYKLITYTLSKKFMNENSKYYKNDILDLQVLSSTKKDEAGIVELNKAIHSIYQSDDEESSNLFSVGDKIMMIENNYDIGYFNGDIGFIKDIDAFRKIITVEINGQEIDIPESHKKDISLSYAITVHKSQGSEYSFVVIALPKEPLSVLQRNLLYTAITRAKDYVAVVYEDNAINLAVERNMLIKRKTGLKAKIFQKIKGEKV